MTNNVNKVIEREGKVSELEVRSKNLLDMSCNFQKTARTVERQTRWKKWYWIIIGVGIALLVVIVAVILAIQLGGGSSSQSNAESRQVEDPN
ncbi:hypothetical protein FKM82_012045 [Ascaphus truei]